MIVLLEQSKSVRLGLKVDINLATGKTIRANLIRSHTGCFKMQQTVRKYYPGSEAWVEISALTLCFFFPRSVTNRRPGSKAHASDQRMGKEGQLSTWKAFTEVVVVES